MKINKMAFWGDIWAQILKVLEEGAAAATAKAKHQE